MGCKFRDWAGGADSTGEPEPQIVDVNFGQVENAADAAVGGDALVLAEFAFASFVHIDGVPIVAGERAGDEAVGAGIFQEFGRGGNAVAVAVCLHLQQQDGVRMNGIGHADGGRSDATGKTQLQPFLGNRDEGAVGPANFDAEIAVEKIPRLDNCGGARDCSSGWRQDRGSYGNESGLAGRRSGGNDVPIVLATRTHGGCGDAGYGDRRSHGLGKKCIADYSQHGNALV